MTCEQAYVAALAGLDQMTIARLRSLLTGRSAADAYEVVSGESDPSGSIGAMFERTPGLRRAWADSATARQPDRVWEQCCDLGVAVVLPADPDFPPQLTHDPRRPAALFVQGDLGVLDARRIGIVGTRNPTQRGLQAAAKFGHELAAAGVVVVSGLAKGVDGAAHRGALAASAAAPVAIVANGHDEPYPRRHADLWRQVAEAGAVISEWPPGTRPDAFRFPLRNRILAALSEIVLVIESRERGGSLITAREAAERGVDVFAVPGPIDLRSSIGTNSLIRDGAAIATEPDDLLIALGLDQRRTGRARFDPRPLPRGDEAAVLALCDEPRTVDHVATTMSISIAEAAMSLARLERSGWLNEAGGWFERVDVWGALL